MTKRTPIVTIVVAAVLCVAAVVGAYAMFATGPGPAVGDCKTYQIANSGGRVSVPVPTFCLEDICEISIGWSGDPAGPGAYNSGLTWEVNFIQWDDGGWQAGPAAAIGGVKLTDGSGHNGNGVEEAILGPWRTQEGSYFGIWDDRASENSTSRMTFQLRQADRTNPQFENVIAFICPG